MTSRALKAGLLLTGCEAKLLLASIFVIVLSSAAGRFIPNIAAFLRLRLKVYGIAIAICPSGKIPSEETKSWKYKKA
jgi:hypothetical protein